MALSIAGAILAKISSAFFGYLSLLGSINFDEENLQIISGLIQLF